MINNNHIEQFKNLDLQAIESIKDEELRRKALQLKQKQGGFTLLELLVVVAILAVMGGLAIGSYGDKTTQAARGAATNTIAAVSSMVQAYQATAKVLPNNLDTLVCAAPAAGTIAIADSIAYGGASDLPGIGGGIGAKLNGKLTLLAIPNAQLGALNSAGINNLRYGLHGATNSSCDTVGGTDITAPTAVADIDFGAGFNAAAPNAYPNGSLAEADIPNRGFDFAAAGRNRGRGFVKSTVDPTTGALQASATLASLPLQVLRPGVNGIDSVKIGAGKRDILVVLGLGNNATMITDTTGNRVAASAPFYGDVGKDKYGRYVAVFKVGTAATDAGAQWTQAQIDAATAASKAAFITVLDARGDFLDEEYAEANGQKS